MANVTWKGSPNFHPQDGVPKLFITLHWMDGTLASTDVVFSRTSSQVSATYGVGQSEIHQYVNEKDYPFSDGNTYANQHTISIEHEGGYIVDGARVTPSPAVLENSAQLCADIARRHGWKSLQWMVNVFPHSHWVATQCPGTTNYAKIISRANELLGAGTVTIASVNAGASVPVGWNASPWGTARVQAALIRLGYDLGPSGADGDYGAATTAAVHKFEVDQHLAVDVGVAGPQVVARLAQLTGSSAPVAQSRTLVVDGNWGTLTTQALQRALGVTADGVIGPQTIAALQRKLGVSADGVLGPITRKALQGHLGVAADGVWGPVTTRALQTRLNAGTF